MARREAIGKKPGNKTPEPKDDKPAPPPPPRLSLNIQEFCDAVGISEDFFYKLKRQGQAPRLMKVGARTLISMESAIEWRNAHEEAAAKIEA